jgi:hypothetical protein
VSTAAPACSGLDVGLLGAGFVARIVEGRPIVGNQGHRREPAHRGRRPIDAGSKPSTRSCAVVAVQVPGLVDRREPAHRGRRGLPAPGAPFPRPGPARKK